MTPLKLLLAFASGWEARHALRLAQTHPRNSYERSGLIWASVVSISLMIAAAI